LEIRAAYDGLLESGSKARKATKAASAGITKSSKSLSLMGKGPGASKKATDSVGKLHAKHAGKTAAQVDETLHSAPTITPFESSSSSLHVAATPGGPHGATAGKVEDKDGERKAKGMPHQRTSKDDTAKQLASKIKHKKLKLAYLARVQRTLDACSRISSSAHVLASPQSKKLPISFVMQPTDDDGQV
jgi:hypothetical protein